MKTASYFNLDELMQLVDEPTRSQLIKIMSDNRRLIENAPGSTHNHQAWQGGYLDHVIEIMNIAVQLYQFVIATGRMQQLPIAERFTLSDALIVLFLHDIEKPWRVKLNNDGSIVVDGDGKFVIVESMKSKANRELFKKRLVTEYEIDLTEAHWHALRFVEGMRDADYSPGDRVMLPLDTFCHTCDLWSARMFYSFPRQVEEDTWSKN